MSEAISQSSEEVIVRVYTQADEGFLYQTWLKSYKADSYFAKRIKNPIFYTNHHYFIEKLLGLPQTKVYVAMLPSYEDLILGYLCLSDESPKCIHYLFTKELYRQMGIATALCKHAELDLNRSEYSHWNKSLDPILKKYPNLTYNPYRIFL